MKDMEDIEDQGLKGIGGNEGMVCSKYAALIIAPGFNQYNTTLEKMVLVYTPIHLHPNQPQNNHCDNHCYLQ
jgi:hypothetical protein